MKGLLLAGRVIFGGFFLYNGINHFLNKTAMSGYAASKGLPQPEAAVVSSGVLLSAAGAAIILGIKPKLSAAAIGTFLGVASPIFHDFWKEEDAGSAQNQMIHFSKNMALLGAALVIMGSHERWPLSIAE